MVMTDHLYKIIEVIGKYRHRGILQASMAKEVKMNPKDLFHLLKTLEQAYLM
jgi:DNA-binding IclR family transcriptional regulator